MVNRCVASLDVNPTIKWKAVCACPSASKQTSWKGTLVWRNRKQSQKNNVQLTYLQQALATKWNHLERKKINRPKQPLSVFPILNEATKNPKSREIYSRLNIDGAKKNEHWWMIVKMTELTYSACFPTSVERHAWSLIKVGKYFIWESSSSAGSSAKSQLLSRNRPSNFS